MALSDRIVVFDHGVVQQVGTPREVYEQPANLFVADFMGLVNKLPGTLVEQGDGGARVRIGAQTIATRLAHGLDRTRDVVVAIRPEAIRLGDGVPAADGNVLRGRLVESTFLGNIVDHQIDLEGVLVRVQGDRHQACVPGAAVELHVAIAECVAMRAEAGPQPAAG